MESLSGHSFDTDQGRRGIDGVAHPHNRRFGAFFLRGSFGCASQGLHRNMTSVGLQDGPKYGRRSVYSMYTYAYVLRICKVNSKANRVRDEDGGG